MPLLQTSSVGVITHKITLVIICYTLFVNPFVRIAAQKKTVVATTEHKVVSVAFTNTKLVEVFTAIEKQTGYLFSYSQKEIDVNKKVTIEVKQMPVEELLRRLITDKEIDIKIIKNHIVIARKQLAISNNNNAPLQKDTIVPKQQKSISVVHGKVMDGITGLVLQGASISLNKTRIKTETDSAGNFTLRLPESVQSSELVISFIGYNSETVAIKNPTITVNLLQAVKTASDEVVVVGYQTIKRKDMMASSSTISAKELRDVPVNSASQALQGRLAGVLITSAEGAPGSDATINIRGRNSITGSGEPLYIVDGVPVESALNTISPQDIESIDVLKDAASTAIYGARGANGVVVITTKGGKNIGGKTILAYNLVYGIEKLSKKIEMMAPYDFVKYQFEKARWTGDTSAATKYVRSMSNYDTIETYYKTLQGIDWQEETMGRNAIHASHNVSLTGGNANSTYNLSLTANKQDGILLNSDLDRKLVSFKFDNKSNEKIKMGFTVRYMYQKVNGAGTTDNDGGDNGLKSFTRYRPLLLTGQNIDSYDPSLDLGNSSNGLNIYNPILLSFSQARLKFGNVYNLSGYLQYELMRNVSFRTTVGFNNSQNDNKSFDDTLSNVAKLFSNKPVVKIASSMVRTITNSNVLTYSNPSLFHKKQSLNILIGQETNQYTTSTNYLELHYFPVGITADQAFNNLQLASASSTGFIQPKPNASKVPNNLASFFTSVDYTYHRRYSAKLNFRADGSSIFSKEHAWGYFPSGSLAWKVSDEPFFKSRFFRDVRVRLSYGTSGNNRITPFSYRTQFTSPSNSGYGLNNALNGVYTPYNLGNEDLIWESQVSQNLGIDFLVFNGKLGVTVDMYSNLSKNLLLLQAIPSSSGYTSQYQNIGGTRNRGVELQLTGTVMRRKSFSWSVNFNVSTNKNKITSLGTNQQILRNSGWFSTTNFPSDYILKVGEEIGTMYGYQNDGFYSVSDFTTSPYSNPLYPSFTTQYKLKSTAPDATTILGVPLQPGSAKFKDINGDGVIDADHDRVIIGQAQPKVYGGLLQSFTYHNFDCSVFINYSIGGQVFNANKLEFASAYGTEVNLLATMNNRWKVIDDKGNLVQKTLAVAGSNIVVGIDSTSLAGVNSNASIWFPSTTSTGFYSQSYVVENASYLRINNITIGYNLPRKIIEKIKLISRLRIYLTANNVALLTGYSGYDPDANTRRSDPTTVGVDYSAYPRSRTYVFGINMSL